MHSRVAQIRTASATNYQSRISYQVNGRQGKPPADSVLIGWRGGWWTPCCMYCRWLSGSHATRLNIYIRTHKHGCSSDAFGAFMTANCALSHLPPTHASVSNSHERRETAETQALVVCQCVCAYGVHA